MGDVRSMILHPATTSHSQLSSADRSLQGISDGLVRLSVGIEDEADLITDLEHAFSVLRSTQPALTTTR